MVIAFAVLLGLLVACYLAVEVQKPWALNPAFWFVLGHARMTIGVLPQLDLGLDADVVHLQSIASVLFFFIAGTVVAKFAGAYRADEIRVWRAEPVVVERSPYLMAAVVALIGFSVLLLALYYYLVGYILFLEGLKSILQGHGPLDDPASMRFAAYSGDRYLAPGYVNQFKIVVLPLLIAYLGVRSLLLGRRSGVVLAAGLGVLSAVFLLGTGQRGHFVIATISVCLFVASVFPVRTSRRLVAAAAVLTVCVFLLTSLIIGRGAAEVGSGGDLLSLLHQVYFRVFESDQTSGLIGFQYIYDRPTQWGADWATEVRQMIPGLKAADHLAIDHLVYEHIYGTTRGTAPLPVTASLWYNFHISGVTLVPFLMGLLYQSVFHRIVRGPKGLFRLLVCAGLVGVLGNWFTGGINTLLNIGLPGVVLLFLVGRLAEWPAASEAEAPPHDSHEDWDSP